MKNDIIEVKIKCSSDECKEIRNAGIFFQAIADALMIDRNDIEEIIDYHIKFPPFKK